MAKIVQLDQDTINKIAAGEVIERPSAVVKELVENAIDAKSTAITIEIKDGGTSLIRITDNGSGINTEDIPLAFKSHATSKISSVEDLFTVSSLGFRGEALSSIAAVSKVELITKTHNELYGTRYVIEGGEEKSTESIGCPDGTTFLVKNLFYNTPVRRKFLKTAATEAGYVADFVERLAISNPNIAFKFINNGQIKMHTSGNNNIKDIIYNIYGREIASNVIPVENSNDKVMLHGFIGKPIISRGNRNYENYYINGRYIKSSIIYKAIEDAYKTYTMQHKYPFVTLYFDIDSSLIDVNVHPTKMEIRFSNPNEIYEIVYTTIRNALSGNNLIPEVNLVKKKEEIKRIQHVPEPFEKRRIDVQKNEASSFKTSNEQPSIEANVNKYMQIQAGNNHIKEYKDDEPNDVISKNDTNITASNNISIQKDIGNNNYENSKKNIIKDNKDIVNINKVVTTENKTYSNRDFTQDSEQYNIVENKQDKNHDNYINKQEFNTGTSGNGKERDETNNKSELIIDESILTKQSVAKEDKNNYSPKNEVIYPSKTATRANIYSNKMENVISGVQVSIFDDSKNQSQNKDIRIVGQVFLTYWIVEMDNKMYIIDQHAAHEKVMYERIMKNLNSKEHTSQIIAPPIIISLNMREEEILKKNMDMFTNLGFEIDSFGGRDYTIGAVPADMYGIADKALFIELIDTIGDGDKKIEPEIVLEKIASMSCKAAVKGNSKLSALEAEQLIKDLMGLDNPFNCPHGRPTIISLTKSELEKKFKRQL